MDKEQAPAMTERDLTLVGLDEDRTRLVLADASGERFTVRLDDRLRSLVRGGQARFGATDDQLEIKMESALRPRDIQARIRAGETPESVAAAAQTTIDKVMGYATPVLAERAHIAERAQRASVRRKHSEGPSQLLGDAVGSRLRERNIDPGTVDWDAWRREDGRWTLIAEYHSGEHTRRAEFVFDAPGRYVVAEDDEAKWLVGERSPSKGPQPRSSGPGRRLSAVPPEDHDDELPLGEDAIDMVTEAADGDRNPEATAELTGAGDADWIATQASDRPEQPAPSDAEPDDQPAPDAESPGTPKKQSRRNRRASVPSWDEIMFGGGERRE